MSVRSLLKPIPESVQEFTLAAQDRLMEAQSLYASDRVGGSLYVAGYAAEMLLKSACARFRGAVAPDLIAAFLGPLITSAPAHMQYIEVESRHSIRFWAMMLQHIRHQRGAALLSHVDYEFETVTERVHNNWFVEMRYRRASTDKVAAYQMIQDVIWLQMNYNTISLP